MGGKVRKNPDTQVSLSRLSSFRFVSLNSSVTYLRGRSVSNLPKISLSAVFVPFRGRDVSDLTCGAEMSRMSHLRGRDVSHVASAGQKCRAFFRPRTVPTTCLGALSGHPFLALAQEYPAYCCGMVREPRDPTGSQPMKVIRPLVLRGARHVLHALSDAICRAKDACVQACGSAARRHQLRDRIKPSKSLVSLQNALCRDRYPVRN